MTEPALTVLSVRGDSRLEVAPDLATLDCSLVVYEREKAAALAAAAQRLDALLADLAALGGVVRTADADRVALTWLARSARSYPEFDHDKGYRRRTGRVIANVSVRLEVRDFALLNRLDATLAGHADLHVNGVQWSVDDDNDAWPQVRAAAIDAAIQQARHYASALGGSLVSVDHVADAGLLDGDSPRRASRRAWRSGRALGRRRRRRRAVPGSGTHRTARRDRGAVHRRGASPRARSPCFGIG